VLDIETKLTLSCNRSVVHALFPANDFPAMFGKYSAFCRVSWQSP
jgi:hypothetical protein